jgi:hypothetical protein
MRWLLVVSLVACKPAPPVALPDGILGVWESWCVTDRDTGECLSKERDGSRMTFSRDGTLAVKGESIDQKGHWELHGNELEMTLEMYGQKMTAKFRARIQDGRLVLWSGEHGEIYGRVGAAFEAAASPITLGAPVVRKLQGITYTLPLPAGYRLGDASEHSETWIPKRGEGFTVEIKVSDRGITSRPDGSSGVPTCKEFGGGEGGGSETKDGVERQIYFDIMTCIEGTSLYARCSVEHTRGYVNESEKDAALALCKPLQVEHRP